MPLHSFSTQFPFSVFYTKPPFADEVVPGRDLRRDKNSVPAGALVKPHAPEKKLVVKERPAASNAYARCRATLGKDEG